MSKNKFSRRDFIGTMPCMAIGTTTLFSSLINLKAINTIMNSTSVAAGDYKALVCVLLSGGNDSFNMLVPRGNAEYGEYAAVRSNLAIPQQSLLPITSTKSDGRTYGLNPNLPKIKGLFDNGNMAFISNVGTLVEPATKAGIDNKTVKVPLGLLSHSDQVMHWQTAFPQERVGKGWGGKMADILKSQNAANGVSMNISLGGNNVFQRGDTVTEYAINNDGGVSILGYNVQLPFFEVMTEDVNDILNKQYEDVFKDSYKGVLKRSVESNETFNQAVANVPEFVTQFSQSNLSENLKMVAKTIAARNDLGAKRQIFFVELGGFDNHDELINNHGNLMGILDNAFSEFYAATEEMGISDCITTYTISDFSRTLTSNGNGTDHAWGGNAMVMGGAVKGKNMYGDYPILDLGSDVNLDNRGILMPTTGADEYFAELALWFGISPNDLSLILPNIGNFYDVGSSNAPMGFLL